MARTPPNRRPRPTPGRSPAGARSRPGLPGSTSRRTPPLVRPDVAEEKVVVNKVAAASAPALARLMGLPRFVAPIIALVVLFAGLAVGGVVGLALLLALAGTLGWFLAAFWPMTPTSGRVLRLSVVLGLVLIAILNVR
ncbi:MAG TPA: hypothetical protein VE081_13615 [Sporichthyaceae bacterium]|nr:hypothetical protein [Sporichthyaceae bacterium]